MRTANVLTQPKTVKLARWMESKMETILIDKPTFQEVATEAQKELGFRVTQSNIMCMRNSLGIPHWNEKSTSHKAQMGHLEAALRIVVESLRRTRAALSLSIDVPLEQLWDSFIDDKLSSDR